MDSIVKEHFPDTSEDELEKLIEINKDQHCGTGSTMWYTKPLRNNLVSFLQKHNITSMLDAPCGDANWMSTITFPNNFIYLGADINRGFVNRNNKIYDRKFIVLDITDDELPTTDMIFVRDCLFHFNNHYKLKFFKNFLKSNIKYILTSNHPKAQINDDIPMCGFGTINWHIHPWNFGNPIDSILDYDENDVMFENLPYRNMCLWSKEQILSFVKDLNL